MTEQTLNPIRKSVDVPLPPQDAFRLFTDGFGDWWPSATHSVSAASGGMPKQLQIEPKKDGAIVETTPSGKKEVWGRITEWKPGVRLDIDWHVGRDASEATQVSVVFTASEEGTRVDLTHDGFGRPGDAATAKRAEYGRGWDYVLAAYRNATTLVRGKITT